MHFLLQTHNFEGKHTGIMKTSLEPSTLLPTWGWLSCSPGSYPTPAQRGSSCPRGCLGHPGHSVSGCGQCGQGCGWTAPPWWQARDWRTGSRRWSSKLCLPGGWVSSARPARPHSQTHTSPWRRSCPQTLHGILLGEELLWLFLCINKHYYLLLMERYICTK